MFVSAKQLFSQDNLNLLCPAKLGPTTCSWGHFHVYTKLYFVLALFQSMEYYFKLTVKFLGTSSFTLLPVDFTYVFHITSSIPISY